MPSLAMDRFWIQAWAPGRPAIGPRVGKWIVFVDTDDVDQAWQEILRALEQGELGPAAKVRTARPHPLWVDDGSRPICIYTSDAGDEVDRERVRRMLAWLGFTPERYKTDEETRLGFPCGGS